MLDGGAAKTSGKRVLAIAGEIAVGLRGKEIETMCRFQLPVTVVGLNNGGIYNGWHTDLSGGSDTSPTTLMANARYDQLIDAFGGVSYNATTPQELSDALQKRIESSKPTLINVVIDPKDGLEIGHVINLTPTSVVIV